MYVHYLTRDFTPSTRAFNFLIRAFNLATCAFSLLTRGFQLVTRGFQLVNCGFELVNCGFELVTRISKLATRVLHFHDYYHYRDIMIACASYELSITDFGCLHSEAVVRRCSVKKVFLEIS